MTYLRIFFYVLAITSFMISCTTSTEEKSKPADWYGKWDAQWETPPESYEGMADKGFSMSGFFTFTEDSLTVQANGYKQCIFNKDTLKHTQSWFEKNDTLFLVNGPEMVGITYKVKSKSSDKIELQLLEDIFVTLTK